MSAETQPQKNVWQRLWAVVDPNERYLRTIGPLVEQINALEPEFETLSQQDLRDRLRKIRVRVQEAREAVERAQAELPPAEDSDTRRRREKDLVAAEKAVLDEHLPVVFAAVREAAKRTLSMRPFDVQLLGGIVLHEGRIAEMKTGEGKTLTATSPLVLNALAGRGAHLITVNDYLARRDAEWMGKIYRYLGLTVGVIQHDLSREARQQAYGYDITYITNHEIGFDYLRDNSSAWRPEHLVIRELNYAIIDEVDSILVDEARVPLIISASRGKPVEKYRKVQEVVARLVEGEQDLETKETTGDFYVDEKAKNATITEDGQRKVEVALGIDNLNDSAHIEDMHLVNAALKANFCYKRDIDYIVGPGDGGVPSVIIVDSFTGRLQPGRRWSDGLHQAIEAKERVPVQDEQQTIATVTYQNFFLMYNRLSGMTGTAKTEEGEFVGIYEMPVAVVPTNRPLIRTEHADVVYKSEEWKLRGICCEIVQYFCRRQPVLVGTRSVEMSERVSARLKPDKIRAALQMLLLQWHVMEHEKKLDKAMLRQLRAASSVPLESLKPREINDFLTGLGLDPQIDSEANVGQLCEILEVADAGPLRDVLVHGVPHEVLNARHHEREAQIVSQAGRLGAITIATNMAGRGTDIVLGGNPEPDVEELLIRRGVDPKSLEATLFINQALKGEADQARTFAEEQGGLPAPVLREINAIREAWRAEQKDVLATGGLHILGTERHESRRIDNQLRGRSGRQGDPGASRFYISLEDELMRLFGPDRWGLLMNQWPEEQPVEAKLITKAMNNAQRKVEGRNFEMRKNTLRYDDVMNVQRKHIYAERRRILEGVDLRATVSRMMADLVDEAMAAHVPPESDPEDWDLIDLWDTLNQRFPLKDQLSFDDLRIMDRETLAERLRQAADRAYDDKENDFVRAVVEFELRASIHETLQQLGDRSAVCQILNLLWPLTDYLPHRVENVSDARVPEALFQVAREALEAGPRAFITEVVRERLARDVERAGAAMAGGVPAGEVADGLEAAWPVVVDRARLSDGGAEWLARLLTGELDGRGWSFVGQAVRRRMATTVETSVPAHCDLPALVDHLDALWPLGSGLEAETLEAFNYGVIEDRLHRLVEQAVAQAGPAFVEQAAEHRLRKAAETEDVAGAVAAVLPVGRQAAEVPSAPEALLDALLDEAVDGVVLQAIEAAAVEAVVEAHRQAAAAGGEEEEEEEVAYGDLQRLVQRLNEQWAFGEAMDPWALERLPAAEVREEMADIARTAVRTRGRAFVTETAALRRRLAIHQAVHEHYSLTGLCARLNRALELPGVFVPESYEDCADTVELRERLLTDALDALVEEPERAEPAAQHVREAVDEGYSLKRLCDRLNTDAGPSRKIEPAELAAIGPDEIEAHLTELLAAEAAEYEERFVLEAVGHHARITVDEGLARYYDVRGVSAEVSAQWPVRPDAVRPSKLKGWEYRELAKRLTDLLEEACRWEEWRFTRRFVLRLLQDGLDEAAARHCPAGTGPNAWDLPALCAELGERWPLDETPEPRGLPEFSRDLLLDELMGRARRAYGEQERSFVRETARHRFGQHLEQSRREHYSLPAAAAAVQAVWPLGAALSPHRLAEVRDQLAGDHGEAAVAALVEPVLGEAEAAFLRDTVRRRIVDSVDDVLLQHVNVGRVIEQLVGRWPMPSGELQVGALRALPLREMVDQVRQVLQTATGSLRRRLVYHNLRSTAAELAVESWLPADRPEAWRPRALAEALNQRLPAGAGVDPDRFAAAVVQDALSERLAAVALSVGPGDREVVRDVVAAMTTAMIDDLLVIERRPQALCDRLRAVFAVTTFDVQALRGQNVSFVRQALHDTVLAELDRDPAGFLAGSARLRAAAAVDQALNRYWPEDRQPGPWVLAEVVESLNHAWEQPDLLHPTDYKGFEREVLREALLAAAGELTESHLVGLLLRDWVTADLARRVSAAVTRVGAPETGWDLTALAAALGDLWPRGTPPGAAELAGLLDLAAARSRLMAMVELLEAPTVERYDTEEVQAWLESRLAAALSSHCGVAEAAAELARRWPVTDLDPGRLGALTRRQMRDSLMETVSNAAEQGGEAFVLAAARLRLAADVEAVVAAAGDAEALRPLVERWPWPLDMAGLAGLSAEQVRARVEAAAAALDDGALRATFGHETVRRRLRQAVSEAQAEHCNPEIASERWDTAAFVAALERDWPIAGRLDAEALAGMAAEALAETAREALSSAFESDRDGFLAATTRRQVGNTIRAALAEHASLERLCQTLDEQWPREAAFSPESLLVGRQDELADELAELVAAVTGREPGAVATEVDAFVETAPPVDHLPALVAAIGARWPELAALSAAELDERLVGQHLQTRLWEEFHGDPRAFVRAAALEDVPRQLERRLMLEAIDTNWCNHLEAMDYLREGINLRGYGQTDPFIAFRKDGRQMFENMLGRVTETVVAGLFETTDHALVEMHGQGRLGLRIAVEFQNVQELAAKAEELTASHGGAAPQQPRPEARPAGGARPAAADAATATAKPVTVARVGRNDPCPCGSGKKYKHCCGKR